MTLPPQPNWELEFPGTGGLLTVLRQTLDFAYSSARYLQVQFINLHKQLLSTGTPIHRRDQFTRDTHAFLQNAHPQAQQELRLALKIIQFTIEFKQKQQKTSRSSAKPDSRTPAPAHISTATISPTPSFRKSAST